MKTNSKSKYVLVLRSCGPDLTSYNGFQWKSKGIVKAPDWSPTAVCGYGLHGFLWGEGDASLANFSKDAKWLVLQVKEDSIVQLGGKIKFPECKVIFCGSRDEAVAFIQANGAAGRAVIFGTATAGYKGTATAGDEGTATAGNYGTATAGNYGTATAGYKGTATAGYKGTATAGDEGTATAGNYGTATAGYKGTATAGNYGTATAGNYGTATAGDEGTATAGDEGTATAGNKGIIEIRFWDESKLRYRIKTGYVGEDGIEPNVKYKLNDAGVFVPVK